MTALKDYCEASFLLWLVGVKFCIFSINAFTMLGYTELSVGCILTVVIQSFHKIFIFCYCIK